MNVNFAFWHNRIPVTSKKRYRICLSRFMAAPPLAELVPQFVFRRSLPNCV